MIKHLFLLAILAFTSCSASSSNESVDTVQQKAKESIVAKLKSKPELTVEEQVSWYYELKKSSADVYDFGNEHELNMYGYSFLWNNKVEDALLIFKLIVNEFPKSANAFDSLGEAYFKLGKKEKALECYQKSLAMNPENFNAEDYIERIKFPEKAMQPLSVNFNKTYSKTKYETDLDYLFESLAKTHPNVFKFTSKAEFTELVNGLKDKLTDESTYAEFVWMCREVISAVNCSHTNMGRLGYDQALLPAKYYFPIGVRMIEDQLYVTNNMANRSLKLGAEIMSINGKNCAEILAQIYSHIPSQGKVKSAQLKDFNFWFASMLPYILNFPDSYEIELKDGQKFIFKNDKPKEYIRPARAYPFTCKGKYLCLDFEENNTAVLTLSSFNYYPWNNLEEFTSFLDSSMAEIQKRGSQNLIVDLRGNGGGSPEAGIHLLKYLMPNPFVYYSIADFPGKKQKIQGEYEQKPFENRFKGNTYFIIDGWGQSTTGHVVSLVKYYKLGTIIGEELGSNQFCSAGQKVFRLPNTRLEYYVANNTHKSSAKGFDDAIGIMPDVFISQSIDDYLNQKDVVKQHALKMASH